MQDDPTLDLSDVMCGPMQDTGPACRRLTAVALTEDHSPVRPDERARILAAGGTVSAAPDGARRLLLLHSCGSRSTTSWSALEHMQSTSIADERGRQ